MAGLSAGQADGRTTVADNGSKVPNPFDVQTIKDLVGLMSQHDLT